MLYFYVASHLASYLGSHIAPYKPSATHQVPVGCEITLADKHCGCVFSVADPAAG